MLEFFLLPARPQGDITVLGVRAMSSYRAGDDGSMRRVLRPGERDSFPGNLAVSRGAFPAARATILKSNRTSVKDDKLVDDRSNLHGGAEIPWIGNLRDNRVNVDEGDNVRVAAAAQG